MTQGACRLQPEKAQCRASMRHMRDALLPADRLRCSTVIAATLLQHFLNEFEHVGVYASIGSEVITDDLCTDLIKSGRRIYFPRCHAKGLPLEYVHVNNRNHLRTGHYQIPEPQGDAVPLDRLDVLLVPGLAFDRHGYRIGYGGGYYDATLTVFQGYTVGLCYDDLLVNQLPFEPHDQRVNAVISERAILTELRR